jgi:hypothetical protein
LDPLWVRYFKSDPSCADGSIRRAMGAEPQRAAPESRVHECLTDSGGLECCPRESGTRRSNAEGTAVRKRSPVRAAFFQKKNQLDTASQSERDRQDSPRAFRSPARNPSIAVAEEYELARQKGTAEAAELFIARHGDDPLAERARAELKRLTR